MYQLPNYVSIDQGRKNGKIGDGITIFTDKELILFLIGIMNAMQGWTATTRHGLARKEVQKRLQDTENIFRKNLQLKDLC